MWSLYFQLPFDPWSIKYKGQRVVKNHKKAVRDTCNRPPTHQYWSKKFGEDLTKIADLDMEALERAMEEAPLARRRWATKQMTGFFVHGSNMA